METPETIKETIVKILQQTGYNTLTACELADQKIAELKQLPGGTRTRFMCGQCWLTVVTE